MSAAVLLGERYVTSKKRLRGRLHGPLIASPLFVFKICQKFSLSPEYTIPCGATVASFEVNSEGNTVMNYEPVVDATGHKR